MNILLFLVTIFDLKLLIFMRKKIILSIISTHSISIVVNMYGWWYGPTCLLPNKNICHKRSHVLGFCHWGPRNLNMDYLCWKVKKVVIVWQIEWQAIPCFYWLRFMSNRVQHNFCLEMVLRWYSSQWVSPNSKATLLTSLVLRNVKTAKHAWIHSYRYKSYVFIIKNIM